MPREIMGLPYKHPAVILNVISVTLIAFNIAVRTGLHVSSGTHPLYLTMAGSVIVAAMALYALSQSSKAGVIVGYVLTAEHFFAGVVLGLSAISYFTGPGSILWHLSH